MTDAVIAEGLVKTYGNVRALDGLDLDVPEGTVLGLLGPNGAGKTTAVRVLTTLLQPDSGRAEVAGIDVLRATRARCAAASGCPGSTPRSTSTSPASRTSTWSAGSTTWAAPTARRAGPRAARRSSASTRPRDRPVKTYSGGMRRRLDLAGALVARPAGAVPRRADHRPRPAQPHRHVGRASPSSWPPGPPLLLTTQYLEEADRLADSIVVIDHGKVIARGTADELKDQVGGERVEVVVAETARIPDAVRVLRRPGRRRRPPSTSTPAGRRDGPRRPAAAQILIASLRELDAEGIVVRDVALRRPTLDDVFLTLTGHAAEESRRPPARPTSSGRCPMSVLSQAVGDGAVVAKRNLIKIKRVPDLLVFTTLSADHVRAALRLRVRQRDPVDGVNYREFLMAGIFAQTVVFGVDHHGLQPRRGPAEGRHRPVPVAADVAQRRPGRPDRRRRRQQRHRAVVMSITGLHRRAGASAGRSSRRVAAYLLLLLFAYAISWVMAVVGLVVRDAGGRQQRELHRDLPADVHRQHVRADRQLPDGRSSGSPSGTRSRR